MNSTANKETLLVALGGNALIRAGEEGTIAEQFGNLTVPMRQIARLSRRYRIIITHGNGPQVGNLLLQQECCDAVPKLPLEILVAQTQGQIGYMIESTLDAELAAQGLGKRHLVSLISYVVVDEDDPAFRDPTKPVGPVYSEEEAKAFHGIDAVIDKDLASARLAEEVGVDLFVIATDVPRVALGYGTAGERSLDRMTVAEARRFLAEGEFPAGSMGPKVEAVVQFMEGGGKRAVICGIDGIEEAVAGRAGTEIRLDLHPL